MGIGRSRSPGRPGLRRQCSCDLRAADGPGAPGSPVESMPGVP